MPSEPCAICGRPVSLATCEWIDATEPETYCPKLLRGAPKPRRPNDYYGRCRKKAHHRGKCRFTGTFEPIYVRDPVHENCLPIPWHLPEKDRPQEVVA